ncbi:hypothetical protein Q4E40_09355 [Pontibacter sp. BT731]|uniref:hypothetical protein n=1 Tax=Pontibacter coccineus TaxID=3063328 RepID=UPI0026E14EC5|nr:hypothetical protein [Pontibacter sp. BT731]MDO6390332.1 hypothetical protein [Pontibacter sp. BT731]
MKLRFLVALFLCTLVACSQKEEAQYERLEQENAVGDVNSWVKADLQCEEIQNADEENPLAVVYLSQMEMQYVLDTVYTCSVIAPQMFTSFGVPREALSACGGWWAGQGNFYYTLHEGDSISVMHASPIRSDSVDFQYTLLRRVPVSHSTTDLPEENYMP